jgi:hypothetical protein
VQPWIVSAFAHSASADAVVASRFAMTIRHFRQTNLAQERRVLENRSCWRCWANGGRICGK